MKKVTASQNQMKANKTIAAAIGSDLKTAFMNASNVKRCLTVPVNGEIFLALANLCHKIGFNNFRNSLALQMVNANEREATVKKYIGMMLKQD